MPGGRGHAAGCLPPVNNAIYDFDQGHTRILAALSDFETPEHQICMQHLEFTYASK